MTDDNLSLWRALGGESAPLTLKDMPALRGQLRRVIELMADGCWHTAAEVRAVGGSEGLRRLRSMRAMGFVVHKSRQAPLRGRPDLILCGRTWHYSVALKEPPAQVELPYEALGETRTERQTRELWKFGTAALMSGYPMKTDMSSVVTTQAMKNQMRAEERAEIRRMADEEDRKFISSNKAADDPPGGES